MRDEAHALTTRQPEPRTPRRRIQQHATDQDHGHAGGHSDGHGDEATGGIEWEDDMVDVNRITTPANMRWKLVDRDTGDENAAIDWRFKLGDQVKIRLLNEM